MTYEEYKNGSMVLHDSTKKECICPVDTQNIKLEKTRNPPGKKIKEDFHVVELLKEMEDYDREHFKVLHLDSKNRVLGIETMSIGTLNSSLVHPREMLKGAILNNANAVILVHNHPSGDCKPSPEDKNVYDTLEKAFGIMGIKVLDNIIIGKECYNSKSCDKCPMDFVKLLKKD